MKVGCLQKYVCEFLLQHLDNNTHTQTHAHSHARTHARARTPHARARATIAKKSTDKPINKLANKTLSLLFWACPSVSLSVCCHGHSYLVIFNQIFSKFHIIIKLSFKFEYSFFSVKR